MLATYSVMYEPKVSLWQIITQWLVVSLTSEFPGRLDTHFIPSANDIVSWTCDTNWGVRNVDYNNESTLLHSNDSPHLHDRVVTSMALIFHSTPFQSASELSTLFHSTPFQGAPFRRSSAPWKQTSEITQRSTLVNFFSLALFLSKSCTLYFRTTGQPFSDTAFWVLLSTWLYDYLLK